MEWKRKLRLLAKKNYLTYTMIVINRQQEF